MRRLKSFLLILVALWLPLQAAAAWTMPLCRHAAERVTAEQAQAAHAHCHESMAATDDAPAPAADLGCDNCGICHLTSAGYMPSAVSQLVSFAAPVLVARQVAVSPSHIGEPPQQPP
jgi:ABC-type nickel/cobalt efflux system permease component RcnA